MPSDKQKEIVDTVADNLVRYRKKCGFSLEALAERSLVSKRMIVEIEQKRSNPSIATLCHLANALGVGVTELVASEEPPKRVEVHSIGDGKVLWKTRSGSHARLITACSVQGVWAEFWHWNLAPGQVFKGTAHPPGTKELLLVLSGELCVATCGESISALASEVITLVAEAAHVYRNASRKPAEFLMIVLESSELPGRSVRRTLR
jgi:transcriptional regulator with XRE-family HTH domain